MKINVKAFQKQFLKFLMPFIMLFIHNIHYTESLKSVNRQNLKQDITLLRQWNI